MRAEAAQLADEAGSLRAVEYFVEPDTPRAISAIGMRFESGLWWIRVRDDSTIELQPMPDAPEDGWRRGDASTLFPWAAAIGKHVRWAWVLENQQGYEDALQLEFFEPEHGGSVAIQVVALNIELRVHSVLAHASPVLRL